VSVSSTLPRASRKVEIARHACLGLALALAGVACSTDGERGIKQRLRALSGATVRSIEAEPPFDQAFEILLDQPLNHDDPGGASFTQRIRLSHVGVERPVVLITEGYALYDNQVRELAELLDANQLRVEHRYFGESVPDGPEWSLLNIRQAAEDHHRVVELLRSIYAGPWVSTGWSKGGQAAIFHRHFFPDDVAATVAYDAPLNFAAEDPRIDRFFDEVGTADCRQRLVTFQREVLSRKNEILPRFRWYARGKGYEYSVGVEKGLEYVVLEYPFSFWQYHQIPCEQIPEPGADADELLEHLDEVVSFRSYTDSSKNSAAMYQFFTELGYYGYVTKNVADLLSAESYSNQAYAPEDVSVVFRPGAMRDVDAWLREAGDHFLYIYGGRDPWSAPGVVPAEGRDAWAEVLPGGNHFSFIRDFPEERQRRMLETLRGWLPPGGSSRVD